ncbi:MAG: hypothetical protein OSJ72_20965 [Lachnospiraceae bacterium]|nr:hypothetical protein [Lachnospiraceae bacterium]
MFDFSQAFHDGIISGLSSGFDILWQTFKTNPWLLFLFAFILVGNVSLKRMKKRHHH